MAGGRIDLREAWVARGVTAHQTIVAVVHRLGRDQLLERRAPGGRNLPGLLNPPAGFVEGDQSTAELQRVGDAGPAADVVGVPDVAEQPFGGVLFAQPAVIRVAAQDRDRCH